MRVAGRRECHPTERVAWVGVSVRRRVTAEGEGEGEGLASD